MGRLVSVGHNPTLFEKDKDKMNKYSGTKKERNTQAVKKYRKTEKGKISTRKNAKLFQEQHPEKILRYRKTINGHLRHIFASIKQRCNNPKCKSYKNYGGRGIKCLFKSSNDFVDYVINELQTDPRNLTIDRIDNNGHYEPGNVRFVSYSENLKNRRSFYVLQADKLNYERALK